ncbi:MAG: glycosyltransferase [Magnetococcales bacterium]|nr:glycosyltransferase [Magnetococcales bacterium]
MTESGGLSQTGALKVSLITIALNSAATLADAIHSVRRQAYPNIEYIVVDGGSTDGTLELIHANADIIAKFISERDDGISDAWNKGIRLATGDIVGFLNSDDFYNDEAVIGDVAAAFADPVVECVYGDLVIVGRKNPERISRYYRSAGFRIEHFALGDQPAHPTCFVRRQAYLRHGLFKPYKVCMDFEILVRFLHTQQMLCRYIPRVMVHQRGSGNSTRMSAKYTLNAEMLEICRSHGIRSSWWHMLARYPRKLLQLLVRPDPKEIAPARRMRAPQSP